jgi:hypothetical protein
LLPPSIDHVGYRCGDLLPAPAAVPPPHDVFGDYGPRWHDVLDDPVIGVRVVLRENATAPGTARLVQLDGRVNPLGPRPARALVTRLPARLLVSLPALPAGGGVCLRIYAPRDHRVHRRLQGFELLPQLPVLRLELRHLSLQLGAPLLVPLELPYQGIVLRGVPFRHLEGRMGATRSLIRPRVKKSIRSGRRNFIKVKRMCENSLSGRIKFIFVVCIIDICQEE